jgi:hypothetical protein
MHAGAVIGQYKLVRQIGEGGMGAVYLAEHSLIGRRAAIKVLLPGLSANREIVDRFFNEARATTSIPDPGIVQVFDFGIHSDGAAYIVMEFLEGESLDARIRKLGRLPPYDALRITRQSAGSLAAAHARGIVHRDLKPENIFLVRDPEAPGGERPKILDFGIAKLGGGIDGAHSRTRTDALMGTPVYMSPEQCRGAGHVDHRSDIYSLGCILFHMLTGQPPFDGEGVGEIIASHLREPPRAPSVLVPGLLDGIDQAVLTALVKDPAQRFQQMTDVQRTCDALMARLTQPPGTAQAATMVISTPVPAGFRTENPGAGTAVLPTPTTLGSAAGQAGTTGITKKRNWAPIAVIAVLLGGGAVGAGVMMSRKQQAAGAPEADTGSATGSQVAGSNDTGSAVTALPTPDAGVQAVAPVDAAVETAATQPDAGTAEQSAMGSNSSGSNVEVVKKKPPKKKATKSVGSSGGMYDDR